MKALQFSKTGDLAALQVVDVPTPTPTADQVLVQVKAAGLNPSDVKNVLGRFPYTTLPRIPGRDFAGVVVEGPKALIGQKVWGTGKDLGFNRDGSHAQYLTLPASGVAHQPETLSFVQAASMGVPYTTAWDALQRSGVVAGTRLLVIGANGAVGSATLGLANVLGAQVLAAVRRPEQARVLREQGYEVIVLEQPEALAGEVNAVFAGGADVIFDTTGHWLPAAVPALTVFGRLAIIAAPLDGHVQLPALALYRKGGSLIGVNSLLYSSTECARMLNQFGQYFDEGLLLAPRDLEQAPLVQGLASYAEVNAGASTKVVLIP
ncbi:quinone oxidoreductase family protein [Pseudomonas helleri]|uniref:quinone oxidoreductase family protein n=1 Tax=Pseudomonas helleri TaxID=1608996 RepID=UPI0021C9CCBD|nr:zinc-binding alcohol dehydrogenase family protein [Pseudomonas helleri]MCU1757072.1 zinc-binding alcohol dehydrogenase family protein [Pseudomonas helleri]